MAKLYITTTDNPWDPATEWEQWYLFDMTQGYNTSGRLASIAQTDDALTESENNFILEEAMNQMKKNPPFTKSGNHVEYKIIRIES